MSNIERLPSYYAQIEGTTLDNEMSLSRVTHLDEEPRQIPSNSQPESPVPVKDEEAVVNKHDAKRSTQVKGNLIMNDMNQKSGVDKSQWFFIPESFFYPSDEHSGWYYDPSRSNFMFSVQEESSAVPTILEKECWLELWHYEHKQLYYLNVASQQATWNKPVLATVLQLKLLQDKTPRLQTSKITTVPETTSKISGPIAQRQDIAQEQNPFTNKPLTKSGSELSSLPSLPQSVKDDISQFHMDGFADKYFTVHKKGIIFKKRIPNQELLWYTKQHLRQPLMNLNKQLYKDALRNFKMVQKIMDDNDLTLVGNICELGIQTGGIRDEIYVQIVKQLNGNPTPESLVRGWKLMGVLLTCFPPSKNFESYLLNYFRIHGNVDVETSQVSQSQASISRAKATEEWAKRAIEMDKSVIILGKHCLKKGKRICTVGPRGKNPSKVEVDKAWDAAFTLSLFGETLDDIMQTQQEEMPDLVVPRILQFLSESLLYLGGTTTEGIFRVPGDVDKVGALKVKCETGKYELGDLQDPNVPSSLLKLWMRELTTPLIPPTYYDDCIKNCENYQKAAQTIENLTIHNRRVCKYVIRVLQIFSQPQYSKITKMTVNNVAMVFGPNFLRCPSDNPQVIFENTKYEQSFLKTLITSSNYKDDQEVSALFSSELFKKYQ